MQSFDEVCDIISSSAVIAEIERACMGMVLHIVASRKSRLRVADQCLTTYRLSIYRDRAHPDLGTTVLITSDGVRAQYCNSGANSNASRRPKYVIGDSRWSMINQPVSQRCNAPNIVQAILCCEGIDRGARRMLQYGILKERRCKEVLRL